MLTIFSSKKNLIITEIYQSIINSSRNKFFYIDLDVPDSFESRFDLVILHSFIVFQYFIEINDKQNELSQNLFDHMFNDFENNLREMGFGDIAVNKRMKKFISAFYGRIMSYSNAYSDYKKIKSLDSFSLALKKNLYKDKMIESKKTNFIAQYIVTNISLFLDNKYEININSQFRFKMIGRVTN